MAGAGGPIPICGRALQERVGSDLTARLMVGAGSVGVVFGDAVAWRTPAPDDGVVCVRGDGLSASRLLDRLVRDELLLRDGDLVRMPAGTATSLKHNEDWVLMGTDTLPQVKRAPRVRPQAALLAASEHAEALRLVAEVMGPPVEVGPTHLGWFGIREAGRLVAVAEARSYGDIGYLARICVAEDSRGQGLGAEITTALSEWLLTSRREVALGVRNDNPRAQRLYERLGFTFADAFSSYRYSQL